MLFGVDEIGVPKGEAAKLRLQQMETQLGFTNLYTLKGGIEAFRCKGKAFGIATPVSLD